MASTVKTDTLQDLSGNIGFHVTNVTNTTSRYIRQTINLADTADRAAGTGWTLGAQWDTVSTVNFKAGSIIRIYYSYPCRNDSTSWGGLYFEPQIRLNGDQGIWYTLGSRGYDAVMDNSASAIYHTNNWMVFDPAMSADFSLGLRFYFRSYDGTVGLNNSQGHDLNTVSGTANGGIMANQNGWQHYGHWIVDELALFKGA